MDAILKSPEVADKRGLYVSEILRGITAMPTRSRKLILDCPVVLFVFMPHVIDFPVAKNHEGLLI